MDDQRSAEPTDTDLAQAWAAGDERAYDAIVARFAPLVFSRCRRALGAADADDATQAVFLVLARKRDQAAACPALAAWLMTVAGNVVRNAWRDRQRRRNAETSVPPPEPSAEEPTMQGIQEHLDACLAALPAKEREAVTLHHLAGHTLAEVARQTGSGVSTVKDRLNRGLERLRTLLAARGVAITGAVLAAFLASEAQAAVPAEVLVHLRDLNPAGGGAGSTAAPSARVIRWSQQKPSIMTRVALAAAGLLLLGGAAWQFLPSAESGPAPAPPPVPAPKLSGDPLLDLDPEHARSWVVLRVNDGARTVQRLRAQPEMALMPAGAMAVLGTLASLREAVVIGDIDSLSNETRMGNYRRQQEFAKLPVAEQRKRTGQLISEAQAEAANVPDQPTLVPAFSGWISCTAADAPLITRLRSTLGATEPPAGIRADGDGWAYPVATGEVGIAIAGGRIALSPPAGSPRPPADLPTTAASPDSEFEFHSYLDLGRPGAPVVRMASGNLAIGSDGLHFSARTETANGVTSLPPLDRRCFERVPAAAILAGAVAVRPGLEYLIEPLQALLEQGGKDGASPVPPQVKSVLQSLHTLLKHSDGVILGWIEPGVPVPSLNIEIDISKAAAAEALAPTGLVFDDSGVATTPPGPITVTCAWRDGRFIVTTNPAGLAGVGSAGGFTTQPEIVRALAVLPSGQINSCLLLRPAATLDLAMPFGAMFVPDLQKPLLDYRMALSKAQSYGFLCLAGDGTQLRLDAGGILALVGCAVLAQQAASPASMLRIAN